MWLIPTLIVTVLVLTSLGYTGRFVLRHLYRNYRERRVGPLRWARISHENRASGVYQDRFDGDDFAPLVTFSNLIRSGRWPYPYMNRGVASFVWMRNPESGMIDLYVGLSEEHFGDGGPVRTLAGAMSARAEILPVAPNFPNKAVVIARRSRAIPSAAKSTVEKHGPVATQLAANWQNLRRGDSACVVFTIDMMQDSESKRWESNFAEETVMRSGASATFGGATSAQAQLMAQNAVRVSIAAANNTGSKEQSFGSLNSAVGAISTLGWKFDNVDPEKGHRRTSLALAFLTLAVAVLGTLTIIPKAIGAILVGLTAASIVWTLVRPSSLVRDWMESRMARGEVVVPEYIWPSLRWRVHSVIRANRYDAGGETRVANRVAPPSCKQVLTLHPAALYEVGSFPRSGVGSDVSMSGTQDLGLPSHMLDVHDGIFLGLDGKRSPVLLDIQDLHYSLYTAGAPSSGKSNFLLTVYAGVVKSCLDHTAGLEITPIWGETKGEGAYDAWMIARRHPRAVFIDVHNPAAHYRLALEGPRLSEGAGVDKVIANCTKLVSSMQAAYGDGIKTASREIMDHALRIAMLLSEAEIKYLELDGFVNPAKPNVIELAFFILGGDNRVDPSQKLLGMSEDLKLDDEREAALAASIGTLSRFFGKGRNATVNERVSSVLNKLSDMRNAPLLFGPDDRRVDVYVGQLVRSFAPIVVNMGSYYNAVEGSFDQTIERAVSQRLIRSFNYLLWDFIKANCNGWQKMGKRVPMFFDEVADIAANAQGDDVPNTLEEGTKEGRSRGAAYFIGSQSPSQMPMQVRHQVLGSRTKFWFNLHHEGDLTMAVTDLLSGDHERRGLISAQNIRSLPNGVCMGIMNRNGTVTPPFTLHVAEQSTWAEHLFAHKYLEDAVASYMEATARDAH